MSTTRVVISLVLAGSAALAQAQTRQFTISTVAGVPPLPATPVPALSVPIGSPAGLAADAAGNLYFTTLFPTVGRNYSVLMRLDQSGIMTRIAGYTAGFSGDGGPAAAAQINGIGGVAVDRSGDTYIADFVDHRVRRIATDGTITTVAGTGTGLCPCGSSGDGGPASNASLYYPRLLATDASGNLYVGEYGRIRKISTGGIITTIAGNGIYGYSGDGGPATSAEIGGIGGLAVDPRGNLYLSDSYFNSFTGADDEEPKSTRVRMVSPDGIISTTAGNGGFGYSGDGGLATNAQLQLTPGALATDIADNLYILGGDRVRKVSTDGIISTIAGSGQLQFVNASGLATDTAGDVYVADGSLIRKISPAGTITTVAGDGGPAGYAGLGDGGPATAATLTGLTGVALDSAGTVYIADTFNNRVRKIGGDGVITTVANLGVNQPSGLAMDAGGNLYIADSNSGRIRKLSPDGVFTTVAGSIQAIGSSSSGDGGPATSARLYWPKDIALDSSGNLYIADTGNNRIRMVTPAGIITTIAGNGAAGYAGVYSGDGGPAVIAGLFFPSGLAVDGSGNLYVADTNNYRVRKISPVGIITTLAGNGVRGWSGDGGPATQAQLTNPTGLKLDNASNLYIADSTTVRMISPAGIITTVAGTGVLGFSGDGGPATSAQLGAWGLAFDASGNLYVADPWGNNVRILKPAGH